MNNFINTIDLLGDDVVFSQILDRTITELNDDIITTVGTYAFYDYIALTSVNFPNVTSCGNQAFYGNTNLTSANLPNLTSCGAGAFQSCDNLTSVNFPNLTSCGSAAFRSCTNLATVNLPNLTTTSEATFNACYELTILRLPKLPKTGYQDFHFCSKLHTVDFTAITKISSSFGGCFELATLILRNTTMVELSSGSAFSDSKIKKGTGYIYVPRALLSDTDSTMDYRQATNWAKHATQFRKLEDFTVDGTIYGELDETKI